MHTWHIAHTRDLIRTIFGHDQLQLAAPSLRSVVDRLSYARFHYFETIDRFDKYVAENLATKSLLQVALSNDENEILDNHHFHIEVGAHVIGCVQSLHAIADIAAHATYYSLGMNLDPKPLKEATIDVKKILDRPEGRSKSASTKAILRRLSGEGDFNHIAALSNYGKHRSLIRVGMHEDQKATSAARHKLEFPWFQYKGTPYPQKEVYSLLRHEIDRISLAFVELGNAIHLSLEERAA